VACGAASGIASAYNAPIAGSFFVAEIILGTIAMESLGPLVAAAVTAALTTMVLSDAHTLYTVPKFALNSPLEMGPYILLGLMAGTMAPWFLGSLRRAEEMFVATKLPLVARLGFGGLLVGIIAINVPEVCGNGYSVIVDILNGRMAWMMLLGVLCCKWLATACSVGSGAPGGVFTPTLFMGAAVGSLFGTAMQMLWPGAPSPGAFALVGMGAFLSAASRAPVMAVILLFEMTLSYEIILPLMLCSVVAFFTARGIEGHSLYSEALQKKAAEDSTTELTKAGRVGDLVKLNPPAVQPSARFAEIARMFISVRVNNIYVNNAEGRFLGAIALHDIKPYLADPSLAELVLAGDIVREDFPCLSPVDSLSDALGKFLANEGLQRLPVVAADGSLLGSLSKNDLMLALVEHRKR
jgi:CIC family chloride channel protein